MFRAMVWKELRETRAIAFVALAAFVLLGITSVGPSSSLTFFVGLFSNRGVTVAIPFVNDGIVSRFYWMAAAVAIVTGMRQTVGESGRGAYLLLLHRPAGRRWLMGMKLLVGVTVCLVVTGIPIAVYGLWAATPGTHASPFFWSMTLPTWEAWFAMTMLYFGAFLSGLRPGRWYRSRLLPLAAAAVPLFLPMELVWTRVTLWPCLIVIAVDAWMVAVILRIARIRDYA